ncbi:MAG TPA: hypothetical protein VFC96_00510, partial [Anaerovoracaceae bacterium]|nr:hypothetical protein [Anaerovoracaceae bacterium]
NMYRDIVPAENNDPENSSHGDDNPENNDSEDDSPENNSENTEAEPVGERDFEYDIEHTREEQPKMIVSINAYSLDGTEGHQLALDAEAWFKFVGQQYLKENGIIVVGTSNIQDRTIQIVDNYEKRQGFDVTIRVMDIRTMRTETIEEHKIEGSVERP